MNIFYIIGGLLGFGGLIVGYLLEDGVISALLKIPAFLIVFGGTFGVMLMANPMSRIKLVPAALKLVFFYKPREYGSLVDQLVNYANIARREGLISMETEASKTEDPFIKKGLTLLADGFKSDYFEDVLGSEIEAKENEYEEAAAVFEGLGGAAPTMGVLGTVMGMISVLRDMTDMDSLGGKIASAFIATMLGVGSANLMFLPLASHIKAIAAQEREYHEVIMEGFLMIQDGLAPMQIKEKLHARIGGKIKGSKENKENETSKPDKKAKGKKS